MNAVDAMDGGCPERGAGRCGFGRTPGGRVPSGSASAIGDWGIAQEDISRDLRSVLEHQARRNGHRPRGVSIHRNRARRHAQCHEQNETGGASFRLVLPAVPAGRTHERWMPAPSSSSTTTSGVARALARHAARERGWHVETFHSAEAFLSSARRGRPGCLVLDVGSARSRRPRASAGVCATGQTPICRSCF